MERRREISEISIIDNNVEIAKAALYIPLSDAAQEQLVTDLAALLTQAGS